MQKFVSLLCLDSAASAAWIKNLLFATPLELSIIKIICHGKDLCWFLGVTGLIKTFAYLSGGGDALP